MSGVQILKDSAALGRWRQRGRGSLGFVPTMGALHQGHRALVERARRECSRVLVSVFVNPTQFAPGEDYARYPRSLAADIRSLKGLGPLGLYAPSVADVYPPGFQTTLKLGGHLASRMEGKFRPGHFEGVATVVARLLGLAKAQRAYFGLKDYQQFLVVKALVRDLALNVDIVGCSTVRGSDGLALSSRNRYLSPSQRATALAILRALAACVLAAAGGEKRPAAILRPGLRALRAARGLKLQYLELGDAQTLAPLKRLDRPAVLAVAAKVGATRLIDNVLLN